MSRKFKMMLPERLGLLILAILLMAFAIVLLVRGCAPDHPQPVIPEPSLIDSVKATAPDSIANPSPASKSKPRKKKSAPSKSPVQPYQRHHLDEPAS